MNEMIPVVVSNDGKRHEPLPSGAVLPPSAIPLDPDKKNLLEADEAGLRLTGEALVSELENNPLVENVDGKLYFRTKALLSPDEKVLSVVDNLLSASLTLAFDPANAHLSLTGADGSVVTEVALPVTPGLPTVVEILPDTQPPLPDGYQSNPYPVGTYLHMRFPMNGGESKDIYINVSTLMDGVGGVAIRLTGDTLALLGSDNEALSSVLMPYTDEELTAGELLTNYTPPPPHGQTAPMPKSDYLHLHFDGKRGEERDIFIDMAGITAVDADGRIWGKRINTAFPADPVALKALLSDMPVGSFVYSTVGEIVFITEAEGDARYVRLEGEQTITGVKTFIESPLVPTPDASDNSTKTATTAFVHDALSGVRGADWIERVEGPLPEGDELAALLAPMPINGLVTYELDPGDVVVFLTLEEADARYVRLATNQAISGVKTFTESPVAPTPAAGDNSTKLATTAFVQNVVSQLALSSGGVQLDGDQTIAGVKTFLQSPVVPTPVQTDNSTKTATTAFVQGAISAIDAAKVNAVPLEGNATVSGVKTFTESPVGPTPAAGDNSTKLATTAFVQSALSGVSGDATVAGVKTFEASPNVPTAEFGDSSAKAASTEFVSRIVWCKVVDGPLPEDATAIVADMPVGGLVFYGETEEEEF